MEYPTECRIGSPFRVCWLGFRKTRAFNDHGQLAWQATFTDGTAGIVVTQVP
jgi:hypothetical protein